jgi:8-oxo-dGTP diphosphatase
MGADLDREPDDVAAGGRRTVADETGEGRVSDDVGCRRRHHARRSTPHALHDHLDGIASLAMPTQIVVAGAVISGPTVLVAQRARPPELAGRWELPGGKVAPGETERDALARELAEELGLEVGDVAVGERLGADIPLNDTTTLRAYRVRLIRGEPHPHDHRALRWVTAAGLHEVDWVPADRGWLADLAQALDRR